MGKLIELNKSHVVGVATDDHNDGTSSREPEGLPTPRRPRGRPRKHKQSGPPATPLITKKVKTGQNRKQSTPTIASLYRHPSIPKNAKVVLNRVKDNQQASTSALTTPRAVHFLNDELKRKRFESPSPSHPTIKPGRRITRSHSARERLFDDSRMDEGSDYDSSDENDDAEMSTVQGSGMYKKAMKLNKTTYVYWDNVNELVSRLRLLIASQTAGHSGHHNEIISIVEELREAGVIKK